MRAIACVAAAAALTLCGGPAVRAQPAASTVIADLDLSKAFHTRSPWRLVVTQGPQTTDPIYGGEPAPGPVRLCLKTSGAEDCRAEVPGMPKGQDRGPDGAWDAHFLNAARPVWPRGRAGAALLEVQTASLRSGDGDQGIYTQLYAYRRASDRFERVFAKSVGHNHNQEVRLISSGPLAGDVISAEQTFDAPYGYWIEVSRPQPGGAYRQLLRYRSATRFGDGNPLAVIDSEMPNLQQRLGLWRPGQPLPVPPGDCPAPHLRKMELWCR